MDISKYLTVGLRDTIKGLVVAVLSTIISGVYVVVQTGAYPTAEQINAIILAGVSAGLAYILKNFFTNNQGQMLTKDAVPPQPEIPGGKG